MAKVSCPECGVPLNLPPGLAAGKKIKCPKCSTVFAVPGAPPVQAAVRPSAAPPPPPPQVEEEYEEEVPRARRRPVEDEEYVEERPARRRRAEDDYEDEYEDEAPRRRRGRREQSGLVTAVAVVNFVLASLWVIGIIAAIIFGGAILSMFSSIAKSNPPANQVQAQQAQQAVNAAATIGGIAIAVASTCFGIFAACFAVAGYGVLKRRQWGRIMTLVLGGLTAILALLSLLSLSPTVVVYAGYTAFVYIVLLNRRYGAEFA
jgi:hypothetical protein